MATERVTRRRVAIVGTGMAGLVTAFLLQNDPLRRYECTLFEQGLEPALDAASLSVTNPRTGKEERLDLPMRAFAGGYYRNLRAMYDFLKIPYHAQRFNFSFTWSQSHSSDPKPASTSYFIHASNLHQLPPPRPAGTSILSWMFEIVYVLLCYAYFTICCFYISPRIPSQTSVYSESLDDYFRRIYLPRHFISAYLAPLIASVGTCTHEELLQFPASDIVEYKQKTNGAHHFVVTDGVQSVQRRLIANLNVRFGQQVNLVEPRGSKVRVYSTTYASNSPKNNDNESNNDNNDNEFDQVILAVPPNIAGQIYPRLKDPLSRIPTRIVESSVHDRPADILTDSETQVETQLATHRNSQSIHLRTTSNSLKNGGTTTTTEALHVQPSGHIVATRTYPVVSNAINPLTALPNNRENSTNERNNKPRYKSTFYRVLRTPQSQSILQHIFTPTTVSPATVSDPLQSSTDKDKVVWKNGDENIHLAGGWAWDGMVLLEGCIVSAMRVARALDVVVPWEYQ